MIYRLIILLLIVGCDNSTEPEVHPFVGVWEFVQLVYTFTALECSSEESGGWTQTAQELQMTWVVNIDGSFVYSGENIVDTNAGYDGDFSGTGTWTTTNNNKLVFTYTDEDYIDIETYDYSITGTTLTLNMPEVNDCSTELSVYTFTKQ